MLTRSTKNNLARVRRAAKKLRDLAYQFEVRGVRVCNALETRRVHEATFTGSYIDDMDELDTALANLREVHAAALTMKYPFCAAVPHTTKKASK